MFLPERLNIIKKILLEKKMIDVASLSSILSVSEVTVRRDLEKLESQGFLLRTHGGAILKEDMEEPLVEEDESLIDEAQSIGKIASYMINDGSTIILSAGSICRYIGNHLKNKKNVRVVTNDFMIASELANDNPDVRVVISGGDLDAKSLQVVGKIAEETFQKIFVDIAFIEVEGVHFEKGITVDSSEKAAIINAMIKAAKTVIYLCDYTKMGDISFYPIGPISMVKAIISNENAPEDYKIFFYNNDIKLITTFDVLKEG